MSSIPPLLPLPPSPPIRRHRKRVSLGRLSSDTTASLPPYRSSNASLEPFDQPPDYPDSAEEADEETEDQVSQLLSPPISPRPRRRKLYRTPLSQPRNSGFYDNPQSQSDIYLDVRLPLYDIECAEARLLIIGLCLRKYWSVPSPLSSSQILSSSRPCPRIRH